jgi:membrane protein implicated in regulation of membrane protease activity
METVMDMQWWHWALLGLVLGLLELATPGGFFILFFAIGAMLVSLLSLFDVAGPLWVQWILFGVFSIVTLFFFRDPLLRRMRASERTGPIDQLTSDIAVVKEDIAPGAIGRAELRGSAWSALNVGVAILHRGQRCAVRKVDGLTLHITAEGA